MKKRIFLIITLIFLLVPMHAWALSLEIDTTLYDNEDGHVLNPMQLLGTADLSITLDSDVGGISTYSMRIILRNTSLVGAVEDGASSSRLTGIGFDLPDWLDIDSGSALLEEGGDIYGTLYYGSTASPETDLSGEWGYLNGNSGHYNDFNTATDTQISTMAADAKEGGVENPFDPSRTTVIDDPIATLDGPPMGLISDAYNTDIVGNWKIQDNILFTILITGSGAMTAADLESFIDNGEVVLTFGSPDSKVIPEPSTYLLMGSGLAGLALWRRKRKLKA